MLRRLMGRMLQADLIEGLTAIVGSAHLSTSLPDLVAYSGDFWPKVQIWKMGGEVERHPPDCVVWPADEGEVAAIVLFCRDHQVAVVPYGGGSGVCGGTVPVRAGVVVDTKRLSRILEVDPASLTVTAEAGILGQHLEDELAVRGFTLGHFPSSIMCSTLGGWIATRSAGQFSSRYGKIEDMTLSVRAVLADGSLVDTSHREPGDPDWTQVLLGSEGTLGLVTAATLRVHPAPAARRLRAFRFEHLADGLQAMRLVMQAGLRPMVLRLYDPFDSMVALGRQGPDGGAGESLLTQMFGRIPRGLGGGGGSDGTLGRLWKGLERRAVATGLLLPGMLNRLAHLVPSSCLMIMGFEGPEEMVDHEEDRASRIAIREGGLDLGAAPGEAWLQGRYDVAFKQSRMLQAGAFVDTMEVATTWDRIELLYQGVSEAAKSHAFVMAHFSHAYREGCSIYFTFCAYRPQAERSEALYDHLWHDALRAVDEAGGTASHHHGVGLLKRDAMLAEHGEMLRVWRVLKDALDPEGIMNPGKLFPDGAGSQ